MQVRRQLNNGGQNRGGGGLAGLALALGNFDGCHPGHRALLKMTQQCAAARGLRFAAMTFEPHPLAVLRPGLQVRRLGGARDKMTQLKSCGVELLYLARFDARMAATSAEDFCRLLFDDLRARVVVVGEGFRFGKGRGGDVAMLGRIGADYGAQVQTAALVKKGGGVVSSGRIRDAIEKGAFDDAAALLGRPWTISGKVARGRGLGASLGFPTANLHAGFVPPCRGIFAAMVYDDDNHDNHHHRKLPMLLKQRAAVSIGVNPTVRDDGGISIEAHLPDFDGDLYGRRLTVRPVCKLRDEQRYSNEAALKDAIGDDVRVVRQMTIAD